MTTTGFIDAGVRALDSLGPAMLRLESLDEERADTRNAIERGYFKPAEEERLRSWFARFLTARAGLLETIDDLKPMAQGHGRETDVLPAFAVAYAAAGLLVRGSRFLVGEFATDRVVQRKLNEAAPRHRIPRKQWTKVHRGLTSPRAAWRLAEAMRFADEHRAAIETLGGDERFASVLEHLRLGEPSLRVDVRTYMWARLRYRWHSFRRRRASATQRALFHLLEASGRAIADVGNPFHRHRVTAAVRNEIAALLRPGDVVITRHDDALSNLLLPGYWPHAALHVGLPDTRGVLGLALETPQESRWQGDLRFLEARKDGVRFRAIDDTLAVDAFAVIRPQLDESALARALTNAIGHEGKLYNFDFDFFTDDRLVCTEVVYRAYDGVGGIEFTLAHRSGRPTLSAEDILDLAVEGRGFVPVAIFGVPRARRRLATGDRAARLLAGSYRKMG